ILQYKDKLSIDPKTQYSLDLVLESVEQNQAQKEEIPKPKKDSIDSATLYCLKKNLVEDIYKDKVGVYKRIDKLIKMLGKNGFKELLRNEIIKVLNTGTWDWKYLNAMAGMFERYDLKPYDVSKIFKETIKRIEHDAKDLTISIRQRDSF